MDNIQDLEKKLAESPNAIVQASIKAKIEKLKLQDQAKGGDEIASMLLVLKDTIDKFKGGGGSGASLSKDEIESLVRDSLATSKITLDDLDSQLRGYLLGSAKVSLQLGIPILQKTGKQIVQGGDVSASTLTMPLFQKILTDTVSMNNVYLFGGAGTGKTFIAEELAKFLGYEFILLNCNQYTSPLEIIGGQTIEGYQRGKLERAWGNLPSDVMAKKDSYQYNGAVLCIDELPKIDPNTAGLFNDALSRVKEYRGGFPPVIENGRGEKIEKGNLVIIATGNLKLNEVSTEYEANFKQDLSLQDRFAGSTYEVTVDYESEWTQTMKGYAFLFIALVKLREKIQEEKWTGFAFVSRRIMKSLKSTYETYREVMNKTLNQPQTTIDALQQPKTLKNGIDSFLNLFKPTQIDTLKEAIDYDNFILLIEEKNNLPLSNLDTPEELAEVEELIRINKEETANKVA